ncbi:LLM class F420-dependent oxidoreductase [Siccirubricoccus deserti]|uniref:TIGR03617 family F420-dependent LLM class oxidoreductase n=1 Tax=Siccirubricoccus deserti TaxID=2013562 RepID=A0A9X0R1Q8_9PROT|nr:TIGR03617 family F420-dependent LLM class oxidoreductase [Siccirubricoccus deserti]MBC4016727.1 TIGR03617 family F420-dependent LLM class oxidoreductase [Siccirubricoccus deserti]GGC51830.1 LLM class F420-dependent oxidoreductase [Siccirubricoccus deserti]
MRVGIVLPLDDWRRCGPAAQAAEAAGFDLVQTNEIRHDPFTPLALAGLATTRIGLATSVAIAFPRSPMIVANHVWDLQRHTGGRFVLGLGTQVRAHNERRFSVPWVAPAARMAEYLQALRAIWRCWETGETLAYEGQHYRFSLMNKEFSPGPNNLPCPPVTLAAVGPLMLRNAARLCDGVRLHSFATRTYLEQQVEPVLQAQLAEVGMPREAFEVSGGGFVATGPDAAAVRKAAEHIRHRVAWYASTPAYRTVLEPHGLTELGVRLSAMARRSAFDDMAALIPDEVLHLFAAIGTYDEIAARIEERFGGLVDSITIPFPADADPAAVRAVVQAVQRIPGRFTGFRTEVFQRAA